VNSSTHEDQARLATKVAYYYYTLKKNQAEIAIALSLSQARISRLLNFAELNHIVQNSVINPIGVYIDLERQLEERYGLSEIVIVQSETPNASLNELSAGAANYLEATLQTDDILGISSWSSTLLAVADAMKSKPKKSVKCVVQTIGGLGEDLAQQDATRLLLRFAEVLYAQSFAVKAPGITQTIQEKKEFMAKKENLESINLWDKITCMLHGIGSPNPSQLLQASGNLANSSFYKEIERGLITGEVCLRFYNEFGELQLNEFSEKTISPDEIQLKQIPRRIGVANGANKIKSIKAAIRGNWINTLITDLSIAQLLTE
jgi:DNA-binding transcriptional regulator LsrR (DeoR family)